MRRAVGRTALGAICLLFLALLGWWLWRGDASGSNELSSPLAEAATNAPLVAPDRSPASQTNRSELPAPEPTVPAPAADSVVKLAHVRGRCLAAEDRTPLAGCTIKFHGFGANSNRIAMQGQIEWKEPDPVSSDEEGRFDVAFEPPSGFQFGLDIQGKNRVPRTGRWSRIEREEVIDLGDIELRRGSEVRGRVVDESGVPIVKAGVSLGGLPLPIAPDMGANDQRAGWSDENGAFVIEVPIPAGTWPIVLSARGCRLVSPEHVSIDLAGRYDPLLVVARRMPSIEGIVVDETGAPVPHVTVSVAISRSGRSPAGRTDQEGKFTFFAVDADPQPVKLEISDPGLCEPPAPDERLWEWGSRDVRIVLQRALSFELTVVEVGSGVPVTRYAVSCYSEHSRSSLQTDMRLSGEHPEGKVVVDRVWRGKCFLVVRPLDADLLPSAKLEFEAKQEGIAPMRVELERMRTAFVRVQSATGAPVAGAKVEVIEKGTGTLSVEESVLDARSGASWNSSDPKYRAHELRSTATTQADGRAGVLRPESRALAVRVTSEAHPPALIDPAVFPPDQDLVAVLAEAGAIRGTVQFGALDPLRLSVHLLASDEAERHRGSLAQAKLAGDRSFEFRGLPEGSYKLELRYAIPHRSNHGGGSFDERLDVPAAEVVVAASKNAEAWLDASALVPATFRGRVLLDGKAPTACQADLRHEGGATYGRYLLAADGSFEASDLLPGSYRLILVTGDLQATYGDSLPHEESVELGPGQHLEREFSFVSRRLVVRVFEPDGTTPAADVVVMGHGGQWWADRTTDAEGNARFDLVPKGPLSVQLRLAGTKAERIEFAEGQSAIEKSITMPAGTKR